MALRRYRRLDDEKAPRTGDIINSSEASFYVLTVFQWILGICSAFTQGSQLYLLITGAATPDLLPTVILLVVSAKVADMYLISHQIAAFLEARSRTQTRERVKILAQRLATNSLRCSVMLWLGANGLNIAFTIARQATCESPTLNIFPVDINKGIACVVQRTGLGIGLLSLIVSATLLTLHQRSMNPFCAHLLGTTKEKSELLPLVLPYRATSGPALFSEMSFKCRSSSTLSSRTLVASRPHSTTSHLLPTCPEKAAMGLGIYAPPKRSTPYFLTPRPSLSSIRTHTTMASLPPPSSPLPPLPVYCPEKYRRTSMMEKTPHPPRPKVLRKATVRIVPPSPALSVANLMRHNNRSQESLSSVYSRSVSGEMRASYQPVALGDTGRTLSSESTLTVIKSPLGATRSAGEAEGVVGAGQEARSGLRSDVESIDDAATLQAKLPQAQAARESGENRGWRTPDSYCRRATMTDEQGESRRMDFTPLSARKTRNETV